MDIEILKNKLLNSSMCEAKKAYDLLQCGTELEVFRGIIDVASSGLVETYRLRIALIKERTGKHAQGLTRSVSEFIYALESTQPKQLRNARLASPELGKYLIWFTPNTYDVMGCLYLIGENEVTEQEWHQIWNGT